MKPDGKLEKLMVMLGIDGMGVVRGADDCERDICGGDRGRIYAFALSDASGGETASATGEHRR